MNDNAKLLNYLVESLGDNGQDYLRYMRLWFRLLISKEEFDREVRKYLTNDLRSSHDNLIKSIMRKSAGITVTTPRQHYSERFVQPHFPEPYEPINSLLFDVGEKECISKDERYFLMHERVLPDRKFIMRRMTHNALENGLEGSSIASADVLVLATQQFIKNIITAVISRRKGYLTNYNKFIHSISQPIANPWLKNVTKYSPDVPDSLRCELVKDEIFMMPGERILPEKLEHETAFKLSASQSCQTLPPISLLDLFITLTIYPSIISSDFLYSITRERIIAKIDHPTFDD